MLAAWVVLLCLGTLAPFDFTREAAAAGARFSFGNYQQDPLDFVFNVVLFVPLGVLAWSQARRTGTGVAGSLLLCAAAGGCLSAAIEYVQGWLASRDSSLLDVLSNTVGAGLGAWLAHRWGARASRAYARSRLRTTRAVPWVAAALGVVTLATSGLLQAQTRLSNWDDQFPLLVGNEATGDRPWRGQLFSVAIFSGATAADSLRQFAIDGEASLPAERLASFDLQGSATSGGVAGMMPTPDGPEDVGGTSSWLAHPVDAAPWVRRIRDTNAFTLRVRCATADMAQGGPARIVSNSADIALRNFTIGQQGTALVVRLRTPATGVNGNEPELVMPAVFTDAAPRDLLVSYDGATLAVAVAGSHQVARLELTPGLVAARAFVAPWQLRAAQVPVFSLVYLASLFLLPGALVGASGQRAAGRLALGACWLAVFPAAYEATLAAVSGRPFHASNAFTAMAVGAAVLPTAAFIVWRS